MKILLAAEIFPPDIGGPATYVLELTFGLKKQGVEFEVICYGDDAIEHGFPITRISRRGSRVFRYAKYFFTLLKKSKKYDIIYAQGPIASGIPAYLLQNIFRKRSIIKVVGDYAWEVARSSGATDVGIDEFQNMNFGGKIGFLKYLERLVCKNAHAVIVPSNYLKKLVMGWEVQEEKIHVIYNSFTPQMHYENVVRDKNIIISIGRLVPWKGFDLLIRAMPDFLKINPEFTLYIYGSGPDEKKLHNLIVSLQLENKVFLACKKREEIYKELTRAGIFILNTGYEGFSHTLLECLSCGIPVVTTNVGGNLEIIEHGKTGLLFPYNNKHELVHAVKNLYEHPWLAEEFQKNAKSILEKFIFGKMMKDTLSVLSSGINERTI